MMITCSTLLTAWALLAAAIGLGERVDLQRLVEVSRSIMVGAEEEDVLATLGEPFARWEASSGFLFIGRHPAQWLYGTSIDPDIIVVPELPFPNPIPFKFRIFSAADDDLVVEWAPNKRVSNVARPDLAVPDRAAELFEPITSLSNVFHLLWAAVIDAYRTANTLRTSR